MMISIKKISWPAYILIFLVLCLLYMQFANNDAIYINPLSESSIWSLTKRDFLIRLKEANTIICKTQDVQTTGAYCDVVHNNNDMIDSGLAHKVIEVLKEHGITELIEFCAGLGIYAKLYRDNGLTVRAFDGTLTIEEKSGMSVIYKDLSIRDYFGLVDAIQCFECGEHIPSKYMNSFLENIAYTAKRIVIMSWGLLDQGGFHHVNNLSQKELITRMESLGWNFCEDLTKRLRDSCTVSWFIKTIVVFTKNNGIRCESANLIIRDHYKENVI